MEVAYRFDVLEVKTLSSVFYLPNRIINQVTYGQNVLCADNLITKLLSN